MRKTILLASVLLLSGCFQKDLPPLPTEPITATGVLLPADLSLSRRGTHLLHINGVDTYYVESPTVSLKNLEGERVGLHGVLSYNLDRNDLPVLRVDHVSVSRIAGTSVSLPAFQMRIVLPSGWQKNEAAGVLLLSPLGALSPLLSIAKANDTVLPEGISLFLGGHKAVRTLKADNTEDFFIETAGGIVKVSTLAVVGTGTGSTIASDLSGILKSIQFDAVRASSSSSLGAGSSVGKTYCGGAAGILCPQGSFCVITDAASNTGFCQQARQSSSVL